MILKGKATFKETLIGNLKNGMRNLTNFQVTSHKSGNMHFDGPLLFKAYKILNEKLQKRYVSGH